MQTCRSESKQRGKTDGRDSAAQGRKSWWAWNSPHRAWCTNSSLFCRALRTLRWCSSGCAREYLLLSTCRHWPRPHWCWCLSRRRSQRVSQCCNFPSHPKAIALGGRSRGNTFSWFPNLNRFGLSASCWGIQSISHHLYKCCQRKWSWRWEYEKWWSSWIPGSP